MGKGDIVLYTCHFDADVNDETPNVCPAVVTKANADGSLNLYVLFVNGNFTKLGVKQGAAGERETFHLKG